MKIVFLTGAGISKESGLDTFRDSKDGLWNNYKIDEVATPQGWKNSRSQVIEFYHKRKSDCDNVEPNSAHKFIADLEKEHEVIVITQNVDNLHERAGSTNVIHVHGSLYEVRSTVDPKLTYNLQEVGCEDYIKIGSKCEKGSQLRPNVVWFGEVPLRLQECYNHVYNADMYVVVGTSFQVSTAFNISSFATKETKRVLVDPGNFDGVILDQTDLFINEPATTGIVKIFD